MTAVLVTSTTALPSTSILRKTGIVRPWDGPLSSSSMEDNSSNGPQYRMDLNKLETYFQSLNRQFYEQKCAVALNVSEQVYRQELAKRQELMSKVDTCMVDVNLLRDFIYNDGRSVVAHADRMGLLRGELEALKMSFRRLELQNAESLELFSRVKLSEERIVQLEAEIKDMKKKDISDTLHNDIQQLTDTCHRQFSSYDQQHQQQARLLESKCEEYDRALYGTVDERLRAVEAKVAVISDEFNAMLDEEAAEQAEKDAMLNAILFDEGRDKEAVHSFEQQEDPLVVTADTTNTDTDANTNTNANTNESTNEGGLETHPAAAVKDDNNEQQPPQPTPAKAAEDDQSNDSGAGEEHDVFGLETTTTTTTTAPSATHTYNASRRASSRPDYAEDLQRLADAHQDHQRSQKQQQQPATDGGNNPNRRASSRLLLKRGGGSGGGGGGVSTDEYKGLLTAMGKLQATMYSIQANVHRIHALRLRNIFHKWVETNLLQKKQHAFHVLRAHGERLRQLQVQASLRRWTKFSTPLKRVLVAYQVKDYLYRWKRQVQRFHTGQRLKIWLQRRVTPWFLRSQPNLGVFLERWKAFIVYSYRVQTIELPQHHQHHHHHVSSSTNNKTQQDLEQEEEAIRVLANANFDASQYLGAHFTVENLKQMALKDLQRKWVEEEAQTKETEKWQSLEQRLSQQFHTLNQRLRLELEAKHAQLSNDVSVLEKGAQTSTRELKRSLASLQESQKLLGVRIEGNQQSLLSELQQFHTQMGARCTFLKEEFDHDHHRLERYVQQEVMLRIDHLQVEWDQRLNDTTQLLQQAQEVNQRKFEAVSVKTSQHDGSFQSVRSELAQHQTRLAQDLQQLHAHAEDIAEIRKTFKEMTCFYDDEVNWLKRIAKESSRSFTEFKGVYEKQLSETHGLLEALMSDEGSDERYAKLLTTMSALLQRADTWYDKAALVSLQYVNHNHNNNHNNSNKTHNNNHNNSNNNHNNSNNHSRSATDASKKDQQQHNEKAQSQYEHVFHRVRAELAAQLSKVARRLAAFIALKSEEEIVMFYIRKYMLQHRHDSFYNHNSKQHEQQQDTKILTMIDEVRGKYLLKLQRELEAIFPSDLAASTTHGARPTTAFSSSSSSSSAMKISVSSAAGTAVTAAERLRRRTLLVTQFLLTVRQCLLAHPAVTAIAGLESVLKSKSMSTFAESAALVNTSSIIGVSPSHGLHGHVGHAQAVVGRDAGQGLWEETCIGCQRPIVPSLYATTTTMDGSPPRVSSPAAIASPAAAAVVVANARSGNVLRPISPTPSSPQSPAAATMMRKTTSHLTALASTTTSVHSANTAAAGGGGHKVLAHSQSVPYHHQHHHQLRSHRSEDVVPLSPGAQTRLKLKETLQRRSERPFSAPLSVSTSLSPPLTFGPQEDDGISISRQTDVFTHFLRVQLHRHTSLSIAAGISVWLSMMLLSMSLMTHKEEERALMSYLLQESGVEMHPNSTNEEEHRNYVNSLSPIKATIDETLPEAEELKQKVSSLRAKMQRASSSSKVTGISYKLTKEVETSNPLFEGEEALLRSTVPIDEYLADNNLVGVTANASSIAPEYYVDPLLKIKPTTNQEFSCDIRRLPQDPENSSQFESLQEPLPSYYQDRFVNDEFHESQSLALDSRMGGGGLAAAGDGKEGFSLSPSPFPFFSGSDEPAAL